MASETDFRDTKALDALIRLIVNRAGKLDGAARSAGIRLLMMHCPRAGVDRSAESLLQLYRKDHKAALVTVKADEESESCSPQKFDA